MRANTSWNCSRDGFHLNFDRISDDETTIYLKCLYCEGYTLLNTQNQLKMGDSRRKRFILSQLHRMRKQREKIIERDGYEENQSPAI